MLLKTIASGSTLKSFSFWFIAIVLWDLPASAVVGELSGNSAQCSPQQGLAPCCLYAGNHSWRAAKGHFSSSLAWAGLARVPPAGSAAGNPSQHQKAAWGFLFIQEVCDISAFFPICSKTMINFQTLLKSRSLQCCIRKKKQFIKCVAVGGFLPQSVLQRWEEQSSFWTSGHVQWYQITLVLLPILM